MVGGEFWCGWDFVNCVLCLFWLGVLLGCGVSGVAVVSESGALGMCRVTLGCSGVGSGGVGEVEVGMSGE